MAQGQSDAAAPAPPGPVCFGFSRTAGRKRLAEGRAGPRDEDGDEDSGRAGPGPPRDLVIPLLRRGRAEAPPEAPPEDGVLRQAVAELLEESRRAAAPGEEAAAAAPIPLLARPAEAARAPEAAGADYDAVPVEAYGLAMLRGMGWRPGAGIGRTFRQVVKPRESALRPRGLGLGASLAPPRADAGPSRAGGGAAPPDEAPGLAPGRAVQVLAGPHRGLRGTVEALDPDNARALVRLAPGRVATLSEHVLRPAGPPEAEAAPREAAPRGPERRRPHWLRRDLRVRCLDRRLHRGRYYNTKMTIEDVLSPDTCVCRTDEGRLLEGLREDVLETLIPKEEAARVMVVLGPRRGQLGRLLGRDKAKSRALVQLLPEEAEGAVLQLDYDAVCHYVGPGGED